MLPDRNSRILPVRLQRNQPCASLLFAYISVFTAIPAATLAGSDSDEFRSEYAHAASLLQEQTANFHASGVHDQGDFSSVVDHLVLGDDFQYWTYYPEDRANIPGLKNYPDLIVRSKLRETAFKLGREGDSSDFYIVAIGDSALREVVRKHQILIAPSTLAATHIVMHSLPELFSDPRVVLQPTDEVSADGTKFVRVEVDFSPLRGYLSRGTIWLRCDLGLAVDHYDVQAKVSDAYSESYSGRVEYQTAESGRSCIPKFVEINFTGTDLPTKVFARWALSDISFGSVTPEMFTLEHFGLGNRDLVNSQNRRWPWFTIVSVTVFLMSSGYLYWRKAKA